MGAVHINYGPQLAEVVRKPDGERWCFHCRTRREFVYTVHEPIEMSYYDPTPAIRCGTCDQVDGDLFPDGRCREWGFDE